ncbi:unnamed protein product [Rhodiola kirilowii]
MSKFDPYEHWNIRLEDDGSCTRLISIPKIPATDESTAAQSNESVVTKDVTLNPEKKTWIRLFRPAKIPSNDNTVARLPILFYLHGGGWLMFSVDDVMVHMNCAQFCHSLPAIMISVEYRLAPENRLPSQYDDVYDALEWLKSNADSEPWIADYGDMSRVYLYGVSNGGNIAFHTALRALDADLSPLDLSGIIVNQPMFGGKQRTKSELKYATDQLLPLPALDVMWDLTLPKGTDRDHRYCNPLAEGVRDKVGKLGRCLVIGFGGDPMVDRQQEFVQMLVRAGVRVEARFDDVGFHGVDLVDPRRASVVVNLVREFI